jgi:murein DD-endopeptidase MepM/ murein hydrolase activator NlpD
MFRTRYTIVIANRGTGHTRRLTISLRRGLAALGGLLLLPVLMGLTARWRALEEVDTLHLRTATLEIENTSYRAATETLTSQIQSLQASVDDLDVRSQIDSNAVKAMDRLPAAVRDRAVGGKRMTSMPATFDTFGLLRDLLNGLENHLSVVKRDVEDREALAAATPTIWPTHGWLSAGYGRRKDPFTGEPEFHSGLDISADKGRPVYATADGVVESARRNGDYGNLVVVRHGFGIKTKYGHLSKFAAKAGDRVTRGDLIGYVGSTGRATGPHLHYEVTVNGRLLNPLQLLFTKPGA